MRLLLPAALAFFLALLGVAIDFCQWTSATTAVRRVALALPFSMLAAAHLVVLVAAAVGAVAFALWIPKAFGRGGLKARYPEHYAQGKQSPYYTRTVLV